MMHIFSHRRCKEFLNISGVHVMHHLKFDKCNFTFLISITQENLSKPDSRINHYKLFYKNRRRKTVVCAIIKETLTFLERDLLCNLISRKSSLEVKSVEFSEGSIRTERSRGLTTGNDRVQSVIRERKKVVPWNAICDVDLIFCLKDKSWWF